MKKKSLELCLNKEIPSYIEVDNVVMDSRKLKKGDTFVAIRGGNNFVKEALEKGVNLVICEDEIYADLDRVIVVGDSVKLMQDWAKKYLELLNIFVIGITGSNGKTSTKDIVYEFLTIFNKGKKTEGNYNNHIGLPFTILNVEKDDKFVVLEMGMSGFEEIDLLANVSKPNYGIITNIGDSHMEYMKNRENIYLAKTELVSHVKSSMIINGDDIYLNRVDGIKIGFEKHNNYLIRDEKFSDNETSFVIQNGEKEYKIQTNLAGKHNLLNLTMAFALMDKLGYDLPKVIEKAKDLTLTKMRFEKIQKEKITYINDAYNASPISMAFALDTFENIYKNCKKIAILGDMLELGEKSKEYHEELYDKLNKSDLSGIYLYGNEMKYLYDKFSGDKRARYFRDKKEIKERIEDLDGEYVILLKGSRGMKLEEIII